MANNLFPNFLVDAGQYEESERFWEDLWGRIDPRDRERFGWTFPWLGTGSPQIKDGNPIFSAVSPTLRRGVRVIQEEPIGSELDVQAWLDAFGGDADDPDRVDELVISCVLSDESSRIALELMSRWVRCLSISFESDDAEAPLPIDPETPPGPTNSVSERSMETHR